MTEPAASRSLESLVAALSLCCLTASCAENRAANSTAIGRDSAGVRIVETRWEVWPPPEVWRVLDSASVDIGIRTGDPDYELFQSKGAVPLSDGGIVIAEFDARLRYTTRKASTFGRWNGWARDREKPRRSIASDPIAATRF